MTQEAKGQEIPWAEKITIVDVTARDGLQDADTFISAEQKLAFISALIEAGVRDIEVTSFMHPKWIPQLADADEVASRVPRIPGVTYSALIPNMRGYERARVAKMDEVVLVVSASESHNRANLNRSIEESLHQLAAVAVQAKRDGMRVRGATATAFGCPFEGNVEPAAVFRIAQAYAEMGVDQVALSDSIGVGNPRQVYTLFKQVRSMLPSHISLAAHFHNRAGNAIANVFAALAAGAESFDAAVGGLGGCPYAPGAPGNISTETLVGFVEQIGFSTGISLEKLAMAHEQLMGALAHGERVTSSHSMR